MAVFSWPGGKRLAVTVNAMLETWTEGKAPPYGVQASPKAGSIDHSGIAWGSYGGKTGAFRILSLLRRHDLRGTFCVNGRCAEIYPDAVAAIVAEGHDVAGHGYLQDQLLSAMTPDEECACIARCVAILEQATGKRPLGWISPVTAYTEHTRALLAAESMLWHGDARDADLPSVIATANGPIVQIPSSDFTDNRVLRSSPQDLWDVYSETFDYLRTHESPGLLAMSMHCHFGGRPMITAVFEKIFSYMRQHQDDVWFATFAEIAQWVLTSQRDADTHARRLLQR